MRFVKAVFLLLICACTSAPKRGPAQSSAPPLSDSEIENYARSAAAILRPRLFRLDRPAITFYYEVMPNKGEIRSMDEANARLLTKPDRFSGILTGLYSEADPKGSRSFGKDHPRLFVLEVSAGTLLLKDIHPTQAERDQFIRALNLDPDVNPPYSAIRYLDYIKADDATRYRVQNRVIELLGTDNRLYHFNEAAQKNCRYDGVDLALQLKDPKTFTVIAFYSDLEIVETSPMAAKIKRLFDDTSFLNGANSAPLPREILRAAEKTALSEDDYEQWKNRFILTCGPRWAFE